MKAWPEVCMTVWASSVVRALSRARISRHTRARFRGPASRQAGIAAFIAGSSASTSGCGYSAPSSMP